MFRAGVILKNSRCMFIPSFSSTDELARSVMFLCKQYTGINVKFSWKYPGMIFRNKMNHLIAYVISIKASVLELSILYSVSCR